LETAAFPVFAPLLVEKAHGLDKIADLAGAFFATFFI
jgi:hypothetical protein